MPQYFIKQILTNINKYILHDLSIELRESIFFIFNTNPRFPHFYYMLANLGLPLYGEVSMMQEKTKQNSIGPDYKIYKSAKSLNSLAKTGCPLFQKIWFINRK